MYVRVNYFAIGDAVARATRHLFAFAQKGHGKTIQETHLFALLVAIGSVTLELAPQQIAF